LIGHREFDLKITQRVKMSMVRYDNADIVDSVSISPRLLTGRRAGRLFQLLGRVSALYHQMAGFFMVFYLQEIHRQRSFFTFCVLSHVVKTMH
jgi:hypothetical protein